MDSAGVTACSLPLRARSKGGDCIALQSPDASKLRSAKTCSAAKGFSKATDFSACSSSGWPIELQANLPTAIGMMTPAQHPRPIITRGFLLAGCVNFFGTLLVSRCFTNRVLTSTDPVVFSNFGLIAIMLWGMAYVAVSKSYQTVPYVVMVFMVEKFIYAIAWVLWLARSGHQLPSLLSDAPLTGTFFLTYGAVDFLFGVFFAWVACRTLRDRSAVEPGA